MSGNPFHTHTNMMQTFLSCMVIASLFAPVVAVAADVHSDGSYEQEFILTAYYSPLPDQCCYIKGSEEADKTLNGQGTHGADGTAVYPGMLAAPPSYAFGTRIVLPGIGTMTVHDRGGAIQELEKAHRLDVWAGHGEEGLARALEFGVKRIRGRVYPPETVQPRESMDLAHLPAPVDQLRPYIVAENMLVSAQPALGEKGMTVLQMQEHLKTLGYFTANISGYFGEQTGKALAAFQKEYQLEGDGTKLTDVTAAYLLAAAGMDTSGQDPVSFIGKESSAPDIQRAQRLLRYFGYYRGRTDGKYTDTIFAAILRYQQDQKLVGDAASPGAGRIGPKTRTLLVSEWRKRMVIRRAEKLIALQRVTDLLAERGTLINAFLSEGQNGKTVRAVQQFLAGQGFFDVKMVNGNFGKMTKKAVAEYQIARGLIKTAADKGAGTVGPVTLRRIREDQVWQTYRTVRAQGWNSL